LSVQISVDVAKSQMKDGKIMDGCARAVALILGWASMRACLRLRVHVYE